MGKKGGADFRKDQGLDLEHDTSGMPGRRYPSGNIRLSTGCIRLVVRKKILARDVNLDMVCK